MFTTQVSSSAQPTSVEELVSILFAPTDVIDVAAFKEAIVDCLQMLLADADDEAA